MSYEETLRMYQAAKQRSLVRNRIAALVTSLTPQDARDVLLEVYASFTPGAPPRVKAPVPSRSAPGRIVDEVFRVLQETDSPLRIKTINTRVWHTFPGISRSSIGSALVSLSRAGRIIRTRVNGHYIYRRPPRDASSGVDCEHDASQTSGLQHQSQG